MVRSETMSFGIDKIRVHSLHLVANKTAILPGEEVEFTCTIKDQAGNPIAKRAPLLYVNNQYKAAPIKDSTGSQYTNAQGQCKFRVRFDLPFIYQTDARAWESDGKEIKSNIVTIFV